MAGADLDSAVRTVVRQCLGVQAGEEVLVVCNPVTEEIGALMRIEAQGDGADATLAVISERETHAAEPPRAVATAMNRGSEVHITCGNGSDLRFSIEGRKGIVDAGELSDRGAFGNLPCGEGFIAPVEGSAEGTLVVDGSIAAVGLVGSPVRLTLEGGHLTGATGDQGAKLMELLTPHGPDGTNVAELGIGTNEEAILTGNILEDEKIFGTAHVAFGASAGIGGTVQVPVHLDVVIKEPTVEIDGEGILGGGELLI